MRRVFALLLLAPLMASCADSATPVTPASAKLSEEAMPADGEWPAEENWWTPEDALTLPEEEMSVQSTNATSTTPAVMEFGNPDAGSPFPLSHDQSMHARWRINPGAVVIDAGETVTFKVNFGHRVAIYNDGVKPTDIQPTPGPLLLYPKGRLFLQPAPNPQFTLRFVRPGKYLVLCAINAHFFTGNQWAWITVR